MKTLAIIGAGGHAKVLLDTVRAENRYRDIVFLDDNALADGLFMDCPLIGGRQIGLTVRPDTHDFIVAIGSNVVRRQRQTELEQLGFRAATIVHPNATVSPYARIGAGTAVFARAVINSCANIGKGCIINTAAVVEHDCTLADFVHISPGACLAGGTAVGTESWVGIGAVARQGVRIGQNCTIGAGAAVVCDIADGITAAGVPARPLPNRPNAV